MVVTNPSTIAKRTRRVQRLRMRRLGAPVYGNTKLALTSPERKRAGHDGRSRSQRHPPNSEPRASARVAGPPAGLFSAPLTAPHPPRLFLTTLIASPTSIP